MPDYDAFISYSHAKDKPIAQALQGVTQTMGKPWWQRRALRLFRDDSSLAASSHLWPDIVEALSHSRYLILLASPEAAASTWVNKEVEHWLTIRSIDTVLIGLCAGHMEWNGTADGFKRSDDFPLPAAFLGKFKAEPKWVDLRAYRDGGERASRRNPEFLTRAADLAATIRGMPKEDLLSDELRQQRRALATAWAAVGALTVVAALAGWEAFQANLERNRVAAVLDKGSGAANRLVLDLAERFNGRKGIPKKFVIEVLDEARTLVSDLADVGGDRTELIASKGFALAGLSATLNVQGDKQGALADAEGAVAAFKRLSALQTVNTIWLPGLAASYDRLGDALDGLGRRPEALAAYRQSADLASTIADPVLAKRNVMVSQEKIGGLLLANHAPGEAREFLSKSLAARRELAAASPTSLPVQRELMVILGKNADLAVETGATDDAFALRTEQLALTETLTAKKPDDNELRRDLARAYRDLGGVLLAKGDEAGADKLFAKDLAILEALVAADPAVADWQIDLIAATDRVGTSAMTSQKFQVALTTFSQGLSAATALAAQTPGDLALQEKRALAYKKVGDALRKLGRSGEAVEAYRSSLAVRTQIAGAEGHPDLEELDFDQAYQLISDALLEVNKPQDALSIAEERLHYFRNAGGNDKDASVARSAGSLAWFALFAHAYPRALEAANEADRLLPGQLWIKANRAHALMFAGQADEARQEYRSHKGELVADGQEWAQWILSDFDALRKAQIIHPLMDEIEASLRQK